MKSLILASLVVSNLLTANVSNNVTTAIEQSRIVSMIESIGDHTNIFEPDGSKEIFGITEDGCYVHETTRDEFGGEHEYYYWHSFGDDK